MNRRSAVQLTALAGTAGIAAKYLWRPRLQRRISGRSKVAILRCSDYRGCLPVVRDGLRLIECSVHGKRVLLKPNLVEYSPLAPINTNPLLIAALADALFSTGAASVTVADGPGHVRDTEMLLDESGLGEQLHSVKRVNFADLNYDVVRRVAPAARTTSLEDLWLPESVLQADVVISMPKVKTHHWAGVTLSLKNLFGAVPGSVYGWPKNVLHWEGIDNSIVELAATVPIHYVIADGIVGMEGNGPLHGPARYLGCLVFANNPIAADATCCRLMGIDPLKVKHLAMAAPLGTLRSDEIEQRGEALTAIRQAFTLMPEFAGLRDQDAL